MEPVTLAISAAASHIISMVDWREISKKLQGDAAAEGVKGVLSHLKTSERERAARDAISMFVHEWNSELEDKTPLTSSLPGYQDQLKRLVEVAAPEIARWLLPQTKDVDLSAVERTWNSLNLDRLPEDFSWDLVAANYARAIRQYVRAHHEMRTILMAALQDRTAEASERIAGPDPGFNLAAYREYLRKKHGNLQLAVMHTSAYRYDRQVTLWSVFVPQSARESAPIQQMPPEIARRLRETGHIERAPDEQEMTDLRFRYQGSAQGPVLEVIARNRLVTVIGNPGSGKSSLLKYLALQWANENRGAIPLMVDLREYVNERLGVPAYFASACATFRLEALELDKRLQTGDASIFFDGLDEVFDGSVRRSIVEEMTALASRYPQARIVVTSRIVGFEPERLQSAGFALATLEPFDNLQITDFLRHWHDVADEEPKERSRLCQRIERAISQSRAIRELAGNPLLLTMMAILNRNQELPRDRTELYREASRVLLHEWDASRALPVDTFARQEKEQLLRELAGRMQETPGGLSGNLIDRCELVECFRKFLSGLGVQDNYAKSLALVQQLTERNFILCFAGAEHFAFVHRTFLEYYAASWFVEQFEKKQTLTLEHLKAVVFGSNWHNETWHEVLRLIAGMVEEKKAEELILFLMSLKGRSNKFANLLLAAGCLSEVRNRRPLQATAECLRKRIATEVVHYEPLCYYEPWDEKAETGETRRAGFAQLAALWRDERTRRLLSETAQQDASYVTRETALRELARAWEDHPETLLSVKDLTRVDRNESVRSVAVQELAQRWKNDTDTLPLLKEFACSDESEYVRLVAVEQLARTRKDNPETLVWLKNRTDKDDLSGPSAAVRELARGWKNDPETLPWLKARARSAANVIVREAATEELARGWKDDPETPLLLKDRARFDQNVVVRLTAVRELARHWKDDPEILPLLKDHAHSGEGLMRETALHELARGWKDDPEILPLLKDHAHSDESRWVRMEMVHELARGWKDDPNTLTLLEDRAVSDESEYVRQSALEELSVRWKNHPVTLPLLKDRVVSDVSDYVRRTALGELARDWKQDPDVLFVLTDRAHSDEKDTVRRAAVQWVARRWEDDPETLPWLKERARFDEMDNVRQAALQCLARWWRDDAEVGPRSEAPGNRTYINSADQSGT